MHTAAIAAVPYASRMSEAAAYKVCPECHAEHTLVATRCGDCDVPLVSPNEIAAEAAVIAEFPPASELLCIRVAPVAWIRALSGGLEQQGVPHRVEPAVAADAPDDQQPDVFGDAQLFGLYVEHASADVAREFDGTIAAQILPGEAPPVAAGELDECPACGAGLAADVLVCPDCELQLG
jgi:hypothetical protein